MTETINSEVEFSFTLGNKITSFAPRIDFSTSS